MHPFFWLKCASSYVIFCTTILHNCLLKCNVLLHQTTNRYSLSFKAYAMLVNKQKSFSQFSGLILCAFSLFFSHQTSAKSNDDAIAITKAAAQTRFLPISDYIAVAGNDEAAALAALDRIESFSDEASTALLIELVHQVGGREVIEKLIRLIEKKSGLVFTGDVNMFYKWLWSAERPVHPEYAEFKKQLYAPIDARFSEYFDNQPKTLIRLDEVRWGGVVRDGIPPLKNPKMIAAKDATWLQDDHVVFGVAMNGDVRAYPKRILAWHEMFKDRIGGLELAGVYCTLCGALVLYDTNVEGKHYELGTSGFLYRSNKLMYDHATKSMWSTLNGSPVIGELVGKNIKLKSLFVVTTTWKEWRIRHPNTTVLSLETGHERNYDEGAAYRNYFATDRLMFNVPKTDNRLANKAEVLALRPQEVTDEHLAISADFLTKNPIYQTRMGNMNMVVLTDASGANRVYEAKAFTFNSWDKKSSLLDKGGRKWQVGEAELTGSKGEVLKRISAHRAFWFGWYSAFPNTKLIK